VDDFISFLEGEYAPSSSMNLRTYLCAYLNVMEAPIVRVSHNISTMGIGGSW
jgi:hypothetical protein